MTADKLAVEDTGHHEKAADKIAADMSLMRELLLEAVVPATEGSPAGASSKKLSSRTASYNESEYVVNAPRQPADISAVRVEARRDSKIVDHLDGAPKLDGEVVALMHAVEEMPSKGDVVLAPVATKVESMSAEMLVSSAQLFGELMCQANLAIAQQTVRSWKANLRADAGFQVDRSAGAVVGIPTFRSAFDQMLAKGYHPSQIRDAIIGQDIELVLTAHPTEAQRRTILKKHQRIVELLGEYDKLALLTPGEISELKDQIRSEQLAAWRTSNVRRSKPSAEGEARNGMMVIEETCWDAVPEHYRRIERSLARIGQPPLPYDATIVRISTWMGGDRDGNPNVTHAVTKQVNTLMRARAAELYYREVEKLLFELSHTGACVACSSLHPVRVCTCACAPRLAHAPCSLTPSLAFSCALAGPISGEMRAEVDQILGANGAHGDKKKAFSHQPGYGVHWTFQTGCPDDEPYRVMLMAIRRRLYKTKVSCEEAYMGEKTLEEVNKDPVVLSSSAQLLGPLEVMYRSLYAVGDRVLADGTLLDLIRRVRTFGISMAKLDLRQESDRHAEALDAITKSAWPSDPDPPHPHPNSRPYPEPVTLTLTLSRGVPPTIPCSHPSYHPSCAQVPRPRLVP